MEHDYTSKEILHAWNNRKYLPGQRRKTLDNLKAFLEALPTSERPQADELAALKAERNKLDASLTEVVEAAERAGWNGVENSKHLPTFITTLAEDLSKAQAYDAARPQTDEIAALKTHIAYLEERAELVQLRAELAALLHP